MDFRTHCFDNKHMFLDDKIHLSHQVKKDTGLNHAIRN